MKPSRSAFLSAIALVIIALVPLRAYAATPPRVVALADLASKPVEVAITSKHLTLIHFETGEVSMVAVGDPNLVSVTVKGADVLLKALTSSGSTNAFIWQGGRYTQWTFAVRQSAKDPRLVIVKDVAAGAGARVESRKSTEGTGEGKSPATNLPAAATAPRQPASGTSASSASAFLSRQQPSAGSAREHPGAARVPNRDTCESPATLDHFLKTLNARQRELFGALLTKPSLATLQMLFLELSTQQRCELLALLAIPASSTRPTTRTSEPIGAAPAQAEANTSETNLAQNKATGTACGSAAQNSDSTDTVQRETPTPAGVLFAVTPQVINGQLFLYYVLENRGEATLLTDIMRLRVSDGKGQRLKFGINRTTQEGYLGRLKTGGVEYGMIAVDTTEKLLILEWNLVGFRSSGIHVARAEIQVP